MKNVMMPIEVISHFGIDGKITPYRFRYNLNGETVVKIDSVIKRDVNVFAGNPVQVFSCISHKNGSEIIFELRYEIKKNKWFLAKI